MFPPPLKVIGKRKKKEGIKDVQERERERGEYWKERYKIGGGGREEKKERVLYAENRGWNGGWWWKASSKVAESKGS